jgi:hypothetical protein
LLVTKGLISPGETATVGVARSGRSATPRQQPDTRQLRKSRITASNSRVNLRGEDNLFGDIVMAFVEGDFNGNDAADVFVTYNSHTSACVMGISIGNTGHRRSPWAARPGA